MTAITVVPITTVILTTWIPTPIAAMKGVTTPLRITRVVTEMALMIMGMGMGMGMSTSTRLPWQWCCRGQMLPQCRRTSS